MNQKTSLVFPVICLALFLLGSIFTNANSEGVAMGSKSEQSLDRLVADLEKKGDQVTTDEKRLLFLAHYHKGQFEKVVMAFEHGNLIEEPGSETAALLETIYAEALLGVGRQSRSRAVLEKLRKSRSSDPRILCLLGIAHVRAGSLKDGIKYLQQAAKMGYAPAHYELAALTTDRTEKMAHYRQILILEGKGSPLVNKAAQAVLSERDKVEKQPIQ